MGHTPGLDDAAKTMNVLDFKIVVSQNPTDVSVFNRKTTERYFSPDVFSRLSKARIRSKQYTSPVAKNALSRGVKCKRRSSFVHLKRRDDLMNCQKRGSKLSRKSESSSDSDNEDDDAASSRNSLVLEKRFTASRFASDYCYQPGSCAVHQQHRFKTVLLNSFQIGEDYPVFLSLNNLFCVILMDCQK